MAEDTKLFEKIQQYKQELTFASDKRSVEDWEKSVRNAIVRKEVSQMDGVKDLIKQLQKKIAKCDLVLQQDRDLTLEERNLLFMRRDEQEWLIKFFLSAEEVVSSAWDRINKEIEG